MYKERQPMKAAFLCLEVFPYCKFVLVNEDLLKGM